jgi:hypothetical protein
MTPTLLIMKAAQALSSDVTVFVLKREWDFRHISFNNFSDFEKTFWMWEDDADIFGPGIDLKLSLHHDEICTVLTLTFFER